MKRRLTFSLKYRLLALLVLLPAVSLAFFLYLATDLFTDDKVAYVYDSSSWVARSIGDQTRNDLQSLVTQVGYVAERFDISTERFGEQAKEIFQKQSTMMGLAFYGKQRDGTFRMLDQIAPPGSTLDFSRVMASQNLFDKIQAKRLVILPDRRRSDLFLVGLRVDLKGSNEFRLALISYRSLDFLSAFRKSGTYSNYLVDLTGRQVVGPEGLGNRDLSSFSEFQFFKDQVRKPIPEGTARAVGQSGKTYLASFSKLGIGDLAVLSFVDEAAALDAVSLLKIKSLLFFIVILSLGTILAVFASGKLTATLRELYRATLKVSEGDFDIRVNTNSTDEVGSLAAGFNRMATEVSRLMTETADKARMEKELETARMVQETLFPPARAKLKGATISGFFAPATECGGDWWHYCEVGGRLFIWIGDATGHGAPAALITSAAKSAAAVIERLAFVSPSLVHPRLVMQLLNRAIYETSRGRILMTFFLASMDQATGELTYCNASHDPPFLLRKKEGALRKKDILPLNSVTSPRLGEKLDTEFAEGQITLNPEELLLCYTDGLYDIKNKEREPWGESRFVKKILEVIAQTRDADAFSQEVYLATEAHREGTSLDDDVTFFVLKRDTAPAA